MEPLRIADKTFSSRLIMGSAKYPDPATMREALKASGTEMVTMAVRQVDLQGAASNTILETLKAEGYHILPNTAGCYTAKEAVLNARLAREALGTNYIKLEVIGDEETLFPDVPALLEAAEELVSDGFVVLPYCNDDPITCKKLNDMGCAAVMPLGAPIGSGMGIRNPYNLRIIREQIQCPLIVDAGVGTASDAAFAMELGMDGVLLNSAVSRAEHPVTMAEAMRESISAGEKAFQAGRIPRRLYAKASSPMEGIVQPGT